MDGLRRDFALETLYEGPGFWGSETFDDPLLKLMWTLAKNLTGSKEWLLEALAALRNLSGNFYIDTIALLWFRKRCSFKQIIV